MSKKKCLRDPDLKVSLCDTEGKELYGEIPYKESLMHLLKRAGLTGNYGLAKVAEKPLQGTLDFVGHHDVRIAGKAPKPTSGIIALLGGKVYYVYMLTVPKSLTFQFVHTLLYDAARNPDKHFKKIVLDSKDRIKGPAERLLDAPKETLAPAIPGPLTEGDEQLFEAVVTFTQVTYPQVRAAEVALAEIQRTRDSWQLTAAVTQTGHSVSVGERSGVASDVVAYYDQIIGQIKEFLDSKEARFAGAMAVFAKRHPQVLPILPPETQH